MHTIVVFLPVGLRRVVVVAHCVGRFSKTALMMFQLVTAKIMVVEYKAFSFQAQVVVAFLSYFIAEYNFSNKHTWKMF